MTGTDNSKVSGIFMTPLMNTHEAVDCDYKVSRQYKKLMQYQKLIESMRSFATLISMVGCASCIRQLLLLAQQ